MSKKSFIDSVKVASPCSEEWNEMTGSDRVRFCSHCSKHVNDLSAMTIKEAKRLVRSSDGKICIRYRTDPVTRRPIFAEQLLQITRRTPAIAASVMTVSAALSAQAYAQSAPPADPTVVFERVEKIPVSEPATSKVSGTVTDPNGAVIPNAEVRLIDTDGHPFSTSTNGEGVYTLSGLRPGVYQVQVTAKGFQKGETVASVVAEVDSVIDVPLSIAITETVEVKGGGEIREQFVTMGVVSTTIYSYRNPLSQAVVLDDIEGAREQIIYGRNPNAKEKEFDKITPLFIAVDNGNAEMAELLLSFRAKVNIRNASRQTPLMKLDYDSSPELVKVLTRYGAKVNLFDTDGNTALMFAASSAGKDVIQALIDAGADVNLANKTGETAIMFAAQSGDVEKVRALVLAGARINTRSADGESALERTDNAEVRELLISYGAVEKPKPVESPNQ